jgi:hypothetical protein
MLKIVTWFLQWLARLLWLAVRESNKELAALFLYLSVFRIIVMKLT